MAVDYLPTARPGFNNFQVLLLVAGLIITPAALLLRRAKAGSAVLQRLRKNLLVSIAATIISLVALELRFGGNGRTQPLSRRDSVL